jgi:hypothetical protein
MKCFLDTETCGLCGPAITLQYAFDTGPIKIHEFWTTPIRESLELLERIAGTEVIGFNLAFDWFQLHKIYNMFRLVEDKDCVPEMLDFDSWAYREREAIDGPCFKPYKCFDLMLHARKTKYQCTMERSDIRIRRVPTPLAFKLAETLEQRIILQGILFARRKDDTSPKWKVYDVEDADGKVDRHFKDVVLKFKPSTALKALAQDALGEREDQILLFRDIEVDRKFLPEELKYKPYALAVGKPGNWKGAWPDVIEKHIAHWSHHDLARVYAEKDVDYTRRLYEFFGSPDTDDDDSVLACGIASCRLRGYRVDLDSLRKLRDTEKAKLGKYPTSPSRVKALLHSALQPTEKVALRRGTGKVILEEIATWDNMDCPFGPCEECNETGKLHHPAAAIAKGVLEARKAIKRIELYDKLIASERLHASFKIIGTLSSRMSGTDDLNPQGIPREKDVRKCFPLAWPGTVLDGGDFDGFEVTLADAAYNDPKLREDLLKKALCPGCKGEGKSKGAICSDCGGEGKCSQKIHALFAMSLFPGKTYEEIILSKGSKTLDMYDMGKRGVFALMYGGNESTLVTKLGVSMDVAKKAYTLFISRYLGVGHARQKIFDMFCSMKQEGGIGTRVVWHEPSEFVESLLGFRRYFTLENTICRTLFELGSKPPKEWKKINIKVVRRDREQTAYGALQSSLYAAAFGIQASNMRAAANHVIQSSGAQITKRVQRRIWDVQPHGSHEWLVQPMNIHDEILCPTKPEISARVKEIVDGTVAEYRKQVPLIGLQWQRMNTWADK